MAGVTADDVRITTGASEALWILFIDAAEPGANVVLPHPGFPTFDEAAQVLGLEVRHYHLRRESEFRIDLDEARGPQRWSDEADPGQLPAQSDRGGGRQGRAERAARLLWLGKASNSWSTRCTTPSTTARRRHPPAGCRT